MGISTYDSEFRKELIQMHICEKKTITELSEEYKVSVSTISRWIITYKNASANNGSPSKR